MAPTDPRIAYWRITKRLGGILDGFIAEDTMWQDARLPQPFKVGQKVRGFGCPYTVLACELVTGETR